MTDEFGDAEYAAMMDIDGPTITLEVMRETIQPGRSFSPEAMDALTFRMIAWVGTRLMRQWDATGVPPTVVRVTVTVDVGG